MSSQEPKRRHRENRPTDPFGGPARQGNAISLGFVLFALAIFLAIQWTNGDLGTIFNRAATPPAATTETDQPASESSGEDDTPVAQATATLAPTQTPAATSSGQARGIQTPRATLPIATANAPPVERASDLPTIAYDELPPEAHETIALIDAGGPFPLSRDGVIFQNRERLLPLHPQGYYREYTVITPGSRDRGARRIVTGEAGEMYYTDDHYASFREIIR